jgi:calcineurin-like phosphoesterase family protein
MFSLDNTHLTSDSHFRHKNVIRYDKRPFSSIEEMDEALINNWNSVVKHNHKVIHVGDLTLSNDLKYIDSILQRLNGQIYFVKGNHDVFLKRPNLHGRFEWIKDYFELNIESKKLIICHYPLLTWRSARRGAWMLHGHCHGSINQLNESCLRLDVGCVNFDYHPVSLRRIFEIMEAKNETLKNSKVNYYHHGD